MSGSVDNLNARTFREQLHSNFKVEQNNAGPVILELVDTVESGAAPNMEVFSIYFRGPFKPRLDQRTHQLEHEKLGQFEIFLTPIDASPENGTMYESVFHRFRKAHHEP